MLGELGWCVSDSDQLAHQAFEDRAIMTQLQTWWGPAIITPDGRVNRGRVAAIVFPEAHATAAEIASAARERESLEGLIHPWIFNRRQAQFAQASAQAVGFVIDAPLLLETGVDKACSVILFVDAPFADRLGRVQQVRGWNHEELARRESTQMPLDLKRKMAHHVIVNDADLVSLRAHVALIHSRILTERLPGAAGASQEDSSAHH